MSEETTRGEPPKDSPTEKSWPLPSWKKIGEFIVGVFKLERSVASLEEKVKRLETDIVTLRRGLDEQSGQLKAIMTFRDSTINERAAQTAEQAALRAVRQLLAFRDDLKIKGD